MKKISLAIACVLTMSASLAHAEVKESVIPVIEVPLTQLEAIKVLSSKSVSSSELVTPEVAESAIKTKREKVEKGSRIKDEAKKERRERRKSTDCTDEERVAKKERKERRHDRVREVKVKEVEVKQQN